jgi:hypothetical protein
VTGISTGALIAPFAFLGPDSDDELERFCTHVSTDAVFEKPSLFTVLGSEAMADEQPLRELEASLVDEELLAEIAAESDKGRLHVIGTVDLDARQAVVWNMTRIAATWHPGALELFRSVRVASAAIPRVFPLR